MNAEVNPLNHGSAASPISLSARRPTRRSGAGRRLSE
jgi:hypothetical protein